MAETISPLPIGIGEQITPFENGRGIVPAFQLEEESLCTWASLSASLPGELRGVEVKIRALADTQEFWVGEDARTPLGKSRLVKSIVDRNGTMFEEAPVYIGVDFRVRSKRELELLDRISVEGTFGDEIFYIEPLVDGFDDSDDLEPESGTLFMPDFLKAKDINGNTASVYLPFNADALGKVRIRFIEKQIAASIQG